ncbi:MAG: hypothetical protein NXI22_05020 [bacterium]|nr:hypothetical protein [bacterium]
MSRCSTFLRGEDARAFEALGRWLTREHGVPLPRGSQMEEFFCTVSTNPRDDFLLYSCVGFHEAEQFYRQIKALKISDSDLNSIAESAPNPLSNDSMYRAFSFLRTFLQFGSYNNDHHALLIFD